MLQLEHFGVLAIFSISSAPTALLLILTLVFGLVRPTKHMFVIHVKKLGIVLDHQSRATFEQYLG